MSSPEQVWNFAAIHAAIATLRGQSVNFDGGNLAVQQALRDGQHAWTGEASAMWGYEQTQLGSRAHDFKLALDDYFNAAENATFQMEHQESTALSSFTGG